jgi:hypothetical protein
MRIARCTPERLADWTRLRLALWPDSDPASVAAMSGGRADMGIV